MLCLCKWRSSMCIMPHICFNNLCQWLHAFLDHVSQIPSSPPPQHTQHSHTQGPQLYAFKGLAGKLGPVGVHASMLGIIAGVAVCVLCSSTGELLIPEGGSAPTAAGLKPASPLARLPEGGRSVLQVWCSGECWVVCGCGGDTRISSWQCTCMQYIDHTLTIH